MRHQSLNYERSSQLQGEAGASPGRLVAILKNDGSQQPGTLQRTRKAMIDTRSSKANPIDEDYFGRDLHSIGDLKKDGKDKPIKIKDQKEASPRPKGHVQLNGSHKYMNMPHEASQHDAIRIGMQQLRN